MLKFSFRRTDRRLFKGFALLSLVILFGSFRWLSYHPIQINKVEQISTCTNNIGAIPALNVTIRVGSSIVVWPEMFFLNIPIIYKLAPFDMRIHAVGSTIDTNYFEHPDSLVFPPCKYDGVVELLVTILDTVEKTLVSANFVKINIESELCSFESISSDNRSASASVKNAFPVNSSVLVNLINTDKNKYFEGETRIYATDFLIESQKFNPYKNYYIEIKDGIGDDTWEDDFEYLDLVCDQIGTYEVIIWGVNDAQDFDFASAYLGIQSGQFACYEDPPTNPIDIRLIASVVIHPLTKMLIPNGDNSRHEAVIKPEDFLIRYTVESNKDVEFAIELENGDPKPLKELKELALNEDYLGIYGVRIWIYPADSENPRGEGDYVYTQIQIPGFAYKEMECCGYLQGFRCYDLVDVSCRSRDSLALVALYHATDGPNWRIPWDLSEPMSEWFGITTNDGGCVIEIILPGHNLNGGLPIEIGDLLELENIFLSNNNLISVIPETIGRLINLKYLNLEWNNIEGIIPLSINNLSKLKKVWLGNNNITGSIPIEFSSCRSLTRLDLSGNSLEGSIPIELMYLDSLEVLWLPGNKLSGNIPSEIGKMKKLKQLWLQANRLQGEIPKEIGDLLDINELELSRNRLRGETPVEIGNLSTLRTLYINDNQLEGRLPSELVNLVNLEIIYVNNNNFQGIFPVALNMLNSLRIARLCPGNSFIGPVPTFPNSPNLDVSSIDFSCITGARLQGSVFQAEDCMDSSLRLPVQDVFIYYGEDSLLGYASGDFDYSIYEGEFNISAYPLYDELYEPICPDTGYYHIQINDLGDTVRGLDFGFRASEACPLMQVSLEAGRQRWCTTNTMELHYRNVGTDRADNARIDLVLPAYLTLLHSDVPYTMQEGRIYRFELGAVEPGGSGVIHLENTIDCDLELGTTLCVDVQVYPQYQCEQAYLPSQVPVTVTGVCTGDSIRFTLTNTGPIPVTSKYWLFRDYAIIDTVPFSLDVDMQRVYTISATGHTYVLMIADYDSDVNNNVWSGVEQCGNAPFSQGVLGQYPTQGNLHQNRLCRQVRGSYDPNDKLADPEGAGPEHYLLPNVDIRYSIRFQNTGNDAAHAVVILDTIDTEVLDMITLRPGASSHPYHFQVRDGHVLEFTFYPIALPDSATDLAGSRGWVSYSIYEREDLPAGTRIHNRAAIYFDNNDPVITNTYEHTVHYPTGEVATARHDLPVERVIKIYPNPSSGQIQIKAPFPVQKIEVYDLFGKRVFQGDSTEIHLDQKGLLILHVSDGSRWYTEKVVVQ